MSDGNSQLFPDLFEGVDLNKGFGVINAEWSETKSGGEDFRIHVHGY